MTMSAIYPHHYEKPNLISSKVQLQLDALTGQKQALAVQSSMNKIQKEA
jgi:hypothetical protein